MEQVILILMLFVVVNAALKMSFWGLWRNFLYSLLCAAFVLWSQRFAIEQSKTALSYYLTNKTVLQDMAVLISIESAICFSFCFTALRKVFGKSPTRLERLLYFYPSLLLFPVLFLLLTRADFSFPGVNFNTISFLLAAIVFLFLPIFAYLFKYFIPEKELRLEVHFLVSLFVCILGLICTVTEDVVYKAVESEVELKTILLFFSVFIFTLILGFVLNRLKWMLISKNNKTKQ